MTDEQFGASAPVAAAVDHARGETDEDLRKNETLLHRKTTTALIPPALSGSLLPAIAAVAGTRTARNDPECGFCQAVAVSPPAGRFQYFNRFLECHDWNDRGLGFLFLYT